MYRPTTKWPSANGVQVIAKGVACNDVKSMGTADPDVVQSLMAFDLVYLNGVSLLDKELIERRKGLHDIFEKLDPSVIGLVPQWECNTKEELEEVILNHYESREEGVIVKKGDSKYEPGARRHSGWWKWKAEYNDEYVTAWLPTACVVPHISFFLTLVKAHRDH